MIRQPNDSLESILNPLRSHFEGIGHVFTRDLGGKHELVIDRTLSKLPAIRMTFGLADYDGKSIVSSRNKQYLGFISPDDSKVSGVNQFVQTVLHAAANPRTTRKEFNARLKDYADPLPTLTRWGGMFGNIPDHMPVKSLLGHSRTFVGTGMSGREFDDAVSDFARRGYMPGLNAGGIKHGDDYSRTVTLTNTRALGLAGNAYSLSGDGLGVATNKPGTLTDKLAKRMKLAYRENALLTGQKVFDTPYGPRQLVNLVFGKPGDDVGAGGAIGSADLMSAIGHMPPELKRMSFPRQFDLSTFQLSSNLHFGPNGGIVARDEGGRFLSIGRTGFAGSIVSNPQLSLGYDKQTRSMLENLNLPGITPKDIRTGFSGIGGNMQARDRVMMAARDYFEEKGIELGPFGGSTSGRTALLYEMTREVDARAIKEQGLKLGLARTNSSESLPPSSVLLSHDDIKMAGAQQRNILMGLAYTQEPQYAHITKLFGRAGITPESIAAMDTAAVDRLYSSVAKRAPTTDGRQMLPSVFSGFTPEYSGGYRLNIDTLNAMRQVSPTLAQALTRRGNSAMRIVDALTNGGGSELNIPAGGLGVDRDMESPEAMAVIREYAKQAGVKGALSVGGVTIPHPADMMRYANSEQGRAYIDIFSNGEDFMQTPDRAALAKRFVASAGGILNSDAFKKNLASVTRGVGGYERYGTSREVKEDTVQVGPRQVERYAEQLGVSSEELITHLGQGSTYAMTHRYPFLGQISYRKVAYNADINQPMLPHSFNLWNLGDRDEDPVNLALMLKKSKDGTLSGIHGIKEAVKNDAGDISRALITMRAISSDAEFGAHMNKVMPAAMEYAKRKGYKSDDFDTINRIAARMMVYGHGDIAPFNPTIDGAGQNVTYEAKQELIKAGGNPLSTLSGVQNKPVSREDVALAKLKQNNVKKEMGVYNLQRGLESVISRNAEAFNTAFSHMGADLRVLTGGKATPAELARQELKKLYQGPLDEVPLDRATSAAYTQFNVLDAKGDIGRAVSGAVTALAQGKTNLTPELVAGLLTYDSAKMPELAEAAASFRAGNARAMAPLVAAAHHGSPLVDMYQAVGAVNTRSNIAKGRYDDHPLSEAQIAKLAEWEKSPVYSDVAQIVRRRSTPDYVAQVMSTGVAGEAVPTRAEDVARVMGTQYHPIPQSADADSAPPSASSEAPPIQSPSTSPKAQRATTNRPRDARGRFLPKGAQPPSKPPPPVSPGINAAMPEDEGPHEFPTSSIYGASSSINAGGSGDLVTIAREMGREMVREEARFRSQNLSKAIFAKEGSVAAFDEVVSNLSGANFDTTSKAFQDNIHLFSEDTVSMFSNLEEHGRGRLTDKAGKQRLKRQLLRHIQKAADVNSPTYGVLTGIYNQMEQDGGEKIGGKIIPSIEKMTQDLSSFTEGSAGAVMQNLMNAFKMATRVTEKYSGNLEKVIPSVEGAKETIAEVGEVSKTYSKAISNAAKFLSQTPGGKEYLSLHKGLAAEVDVATSRSGKIGGYIADRFGEDALDPSSNGAFARRLLSGYAAFQAARAIRYSFAPLEQSAQARTAMNTGAATTLNMFAGGNIPVSEIPLNRMNANLRSAELAFGTQGSALLGGIGSLTGGLDSVARGPLGTLAAIAGPAAGSSMMAAAFGASAKVAGGVGLAVGALSGLSYLTGASKDLPEQMIARMAYQQTGMSNMPGAWYASPQNAFQALNNTFDNGASVPGVLGFAWNSIIDPDKAAKVEDTAIRASSTPYYDRKAPPLVRLAALMKAARQGSATGDYMAERGLSEDRRMSILSTIASYTDDPAHALYAMQALTEQASLGIGEDQVMAAVGENSRYRGDLRSRPGIETFTKTIAGRGKRFDLKEVLDQNTALQMMGGLDTIVNRMRGGVAATQDEAVEQLLRQSPRDHVQAELVRERSRVLPMLLGRGVGIGTRQLLADQLVGTAYSSGFTSEQVMSVLDESAQRRGNYSLFAGNSLIGSPLNIQSEMQRNANYGAIGGQPASVMLSAMGLNTQGVIDGPGLSPMAAQGIQSLANLDPVAITQALSSGANLGGMKPLTDLSTGARLFQRSMWGLNGPSAPSAGQIRSFLQAGIANSSSGSIAVPAGSPRVVDALSGKTFGVGGQTGLAMLSQQYNYEAQAASAGVQMSQIRAGHAFTVNFSQPMQQMDMAMSYARDFGGTVQTEWMRKMGIPAANMGRGRFAWEWQQMGIQQRDMAAGYSQSVTRSDWQMQDVLREQSRAGISANWQRQDLSIGRARTLLNRDFQMWQYGFQGEELALNRRYANEDYAYGRQTSRMQFGWQMQDFAIGRQQGRMQFGWQMQDFAFNRETRGLTFGWQMEDYDRNIRRSTGYQRQQLIRERDRAVVMHGRESEQDNRQEDRTRTLHRLEEQRLARQEARTRTLFALEEQQAARQKSRQDESFKRQEEYLKKQIEHFKAVNKLEDEEYGNQRTRLEQQEQWRTEDFEIRKDRISKEREWLDGNYERSKEGFEIRKEQLVAEESAAKTNHALQTVRFEAERKHELEMYKLQLSAAGISAGHARKMEEINRTQGLILKAEEDRFLYLNKFVSDVRWPYIKEVIERLITLSGGTSTVPVVTPATPPAPMSQKGPVIHNIIKLDGKVLAESVVKHGAPALYRDSRRSFYR